MLAISRDRLVGLSRLLQLHRQVAIRVLVIRIQLELLAERRDRLRMMVGAGVRQPQVVPPVF